MSSGDDDDFNPFRDESSEDDEDDPWLIRKDHKKNKDKKKKRKSIDPDSIQSALLASGLGSKRPSFLLHQLFHLLLTVHQLTVTPTATVAL